MLHGGVHAAGARIGKDHRHAHAQEVPGHNHPAIVSTLEYKEPLPGAHIESICHLTSGKGLHHVDL